MIRPNFTGATRCAAALRVQRRWRYNGVITRPLGRPRLEDETIPKTRYPVITELEANASSGLGRRKCWPDGRRTTHLRCEIVSPELCGTFCENPVWALGLLN
jgi:hypothetical protein